MTPNLAGPSGQSSASLLLPSSASLPPSTGLHFYPNLREGRTLFCSKNPSVCFLSQHPPVNLRDFTPSSFLSFIFKLCSTTAFWKHEVSSLKHKSEHPSLSTRSSPQADVLCLEYACSSLDLNNQIPPVNIVSTSFPCIHSSMHCNHFSHSPLTVIASKKKNFHNFLIAKPKGHFSFLTIHDLSTASHAVKYSFSPPKP